MPKYANACSALHNHPETHQPLAPRPLEETGLRAEATEAEGGATAPQERASRILLPTNRLRVPFTSQTNSSIPATNKGRRALLAQDLPLPGTSSLSANPEVLKDVVASASLLAAPDQAHELALTSLCDMSRTIIMIQLLRPSGQVAAALNLLGSLRKHRLMGHFIPTKHDWTQTSKTAFKNAYYDFTISDVKGDFPSSDAWKPTLWEVSIG